MDSLALRVASLFSVRLADEGEEEPSGKGGVPPRWQEWLDAVHQGGKKQVPNPNPDTRERYPQVAFTTALKDKEVFKKALKEYREWAKKNPEKDDKAPPKDDGSKEESGKSETKSKGEIDLVSDDEIDTVRKKHAKDFESVIQEGRQKLKDFKYNKTEVANQEWEGLSEAEKLIHVVGHLIGRKFEASLKGEDKSTHEKFYDEWRAWPSFPAPMKMMGALSARGVPGSMAPGEHESSKKNFEEGKKTRSCLSTLRRRMLFSKHSSNTWGSKS